MPLTNFDKQVIQNNAMDRIGNLESMLSSNMRDNVNINDASDVMQNLGSGLPYQAGETLMDVDGIHSAADLIDVKFWASIGVPSNVITQVAALFIDGNDLYVGGNFLRIGGIAANYIARYNLLTGVWSNLGSATALNGAVYAIAVIGSTIYVGGNFTNADGIAAADYIASCTTAGVWAALGVGLNNVVNDLAVIGSTLFVGGDFIDAAGIAAADYIAKWSAGAWSAVGAGLNGTVLSLAVYGTSIFIGGLFTDAGGVAAADGLAKWDGANYTAVGTGSPGGVLALCVSNDDLYIGGGFFSAGGLTGADCIVVFNISTSTYRLLGDASAFALEVNTIAVIGQDVFIGGLFTSVNGIANTAYIVKFDGLNYSSIGTLNNTVYGLAVYGSDLYIVGTFTTINGRSSKGITAYIRTLKSVLEYLEIVEQALQDGLIYSGTASVERILSAGTELGSVAITASTTTVFDIPIPANFLSGESLVKFRINLQIVTNVNTRVLTTVLFYGATTLITGTPNYGASKTHEITIEGEIWATGSNAQKARMAFIRNDITTPAYFFSASTGTGAENVSTAKNLKLTLQLAGTVTSSQIYNEVVELVPAP